MPRRARKTRRGVERRLRRHFGDQRDRNNCRLPNRRQNGAWPSRNQPREKPPATAFAVGIRRFGLLIMRLTILMVLFVLVVNISFHRPVLESLMFALALAVGLTPNSAHDRHRHACALGAGIVQAKGDRKATFRNSRSRRHGCPVHDKTGTLTEAAIKLMRAIDGQGADSQSAYTYAFVNSRFETGMKSPLDAAILRQSRSIWLNGRRSTKYHSI